MMATSMRAAARRGADSTLVCIGNLTIDEAVHDSLLADSETAVARPEAASAPRDRLRSAPAMGGDAAYAALAARLHLADVRMLAPIGTDLPSSFFSTLRAAGIRTDDLPHRNLPTVRNIIDYFADGTRRWNMLCSEADFDALSVYPADVPAWALEADAILISAMSLESQLALTPWLRANSEARLYLDLQEDYLVGARDALFGIIAECDVFLPSEVEAVALAQTDDLITAGRLFQSLGPDTVVIKRAERGSLVFDGSSLTEVATDHVEPVDSTGAGDAFCGAFAAVHCQTGDAVEAARAGAAAARIAITAFGIEALAAATTDHVSHERADAR
jgi:ribokinase